MLKTKAQSRTIFQLSLVFIVLLAVVLARHFWPTADKSTITQYQKYWGKLTAANITAFTLSQKEQSLDLRREGSLWKLADYQADANAIAGWLDQLLHPASPLIVAETSATHPKFGLDADHIVTLTLKTGDQTYPVDLGQTSGSGRYLKFPNQDTVYLIPDLPSHLNSLTLADWVNKTILSVSADTLQSLTLTTPRYSLNLTHQDNQWFTPAISGPIDDTVLQPLLTHLASLTTNGLTDQAKPTTKPSLTLELSQAGSTITLTFYRQDDNQTLVTASDRAGLFTLSTTTFDKLPLAPTDLQPQPTPSPTPA